MFKFVKNFLLQTILVFINMQNCLLAEIPAVTKLSPFETPDFTDIDLERPAKNVRLNFFIHGTYGVSTASASIGKIVLNSNVSGSAHELLSRSLLRQKSKLLYNLSLMYDEGLFRINPHAKNIDEKLISLALFPTIQAFDYIKHLSQKSNDAIDLFYVFGWHGLLSQSGRMESSAALYNAITWEKNALAEHLASINSDKTIQVQVYGHSHGGNVALNLAWINNYENLNNIKKLYTTFDLDKVGEICSQGCFEQVQNLTSKYVQKDCQVKYPMDEWLYQPEKSKTPSPLVNKLYLLATPIQAETWPLIFSNTFEQTVNLYSDKDFIQIADIFSTQTHSSKRTVAQCLVTQGNETFKLCEKKRLVQIEVQHSSTSCSEITGPSHKDFWFINWNETDNQNNLKPEPVLCIAPFVHDLLDKIPDDNFIFDLKSDDGKLMLALKDRSLQKTFLLKTLDAADLQKLRQYFLSKKTLLEAQKHLGEDATIARKFNKLVAWLASWSSSKK